MRTVLLIPLLPLQTVRDRLIELPLGNKLVDIILLGVVLGAMFKGGFKFLQTPLNRLLLATESSAIFSFGVGRSF